MRNSRPIVDGRKPRGRKSRRGGGQCRASRAALVLEPMLRNLRVVSCLPLLVGAFHCTTDGLLLRGIWAGVHILERNSPLPLMAHDEVLNPVIGITYGEHHPL